MRKLNVQVVLLKNNIVIIQKKKEKNKIKNKNTKYL